MLDQPEIRIVGEDAGPRDKAVVESVLGKDKNSEFDMNKVLKGNGPKPTELKAQELE